MLLTGMSASLSAGKFEDTKKTCASGNAKACSNLGIMYGNGQGV